MEVAPKDLCVCGHKIANHMNSRNCWDCKWDGIDPYCKHFKLDNLKYLEMLYEQKFV